MKVSWDKFVFHSGTKFGSDVSNELQNRKEVTIPEPEYSQEILDRHKKREALHVIQLRRLQDARQLQKAALQAIVDDPDKLAAYPETPVKLAELNNEIDKADFEASEPLPIQLTDTERMQMNNDSKSIKE